MNRSTALLYGVVIGLIAIIAWEIYKPAAIIEVPFVDSTELIDLVPEPEPQPTPTPQPQPQPQPQPAPAPAPQFGQVLKVESDQAVLDLIEIIDKGTGGLFYFSQPGCDPCKWQKPIIESLAVKYPKLLFLEVDAKKCKHMRSLYKITKTPTILIKKERFEKPTMEQTIVDTMRKYFPDEIQSPN